VATAAFGIATVFWALLGDLLFALVNAFWASALLLLTLFAFHRPRLETTLEQSFWWYTEGRGLTPERGTKFFCYNLLWCIVLISSGLIIDRSRTVVRDALSS